MRGQGGGLGGAGADFFLNFSLFLRVFDGSWLWGATFLNVFFLNFFYDSNSPLALCQHQNGV